MDRWPEAVPPPPKPSNVTPLPSNSTAPGSERTINVPLPTMPAGNSSTRLRIWSVATPCARTSRSYCSPSPLRSINPYTSALDSGKLSSARSNNTESLRTSTVPRAPVTSSAGCEMRALREATSNRTPLSSGFGEASRTYGSLASTSKNRRTHISPPIPSSTSRPLALLESVGVRMVISAFVISTSLNAINKPEPGTTAALSMSLLSAFFEANISATFMDRPRG